MNVTVGRNTIFFVDAVAELALYQGMLEKLRPAGTPKI